MTISIKAWQKYINRLKAINNTSVAEMVKVLEYVNFEKLSEDAREEIIKYAYRLTQTYGEAAGALACEMYDAVAELSGAPVPAAVPAYPATYKEVAKTVNGTIKTANIDVVAQAVGRLVKMTGTDTIVKNAIRDRAETAWVTMGDTCAFCTIMASRGWETASQSDLKDNHTKHIHSNCDCMYAVRFNKETSVEGYDPGAIYDRYLRGGKNAAERTATLRRRYYEENREKILEQKKHAYERAKALEGE